MADALSRVEQVVIQATNESPLLAAATVLLPAATHLEDEGTFTQQDGITQRHRRGYPARGEAQPNWKWAVELQRELGSESLWQSARDVFRAVAPKVEELASFAWDAEAPRNRERNGINPISTGSDGRPAGYREFGVPRVRGI